MRHGGSWPDGKQLDQRHRQSGGGNWFQQQRQESMDQVPSDEEKEPNEPTCIETS